MRARTIIILFILGLIIKGLDAQTLNNYNGIELDIGQMHSGKNLRLGYSLIGKNLILSAGTKIHFNNPNLEDSRGYAFQYRFHAYTPIQHFGLYAKGGVNLLQSKTDNWKLRFLIDFEFGRLGLKGILYEPAFIDPSINNSPVHMDTNGYVFFRGYPYNPKIANHLQSSLAVNFSNKVTDQLNLNISIGISTSFVLTENQVLYDEINNLTYTEYKKLHWEPFNPYLRLGFSYNFKKKEKTKTATES
jgi:hypothetical protein